MARKIADFYAEYTVKDNGTKVVKKIDKENKALAKSVKSSGNEFKKSAKSTDEATNALKRFNKENERAKKSGGGGGGLFGKARDRLQKGGDALGSAASGNVFGAAGKTIPILGAVVVAAAVSIEKAAAAITEASNILQQRAGFDRARVSSASFGQAGTKLQAAGFAENDVESAIVALADKGITELSNRQLKVIQIEAARIGTVTGAVENILSGTGFRSLGQEGKNIESIAENLDYSSQAAVTSFQIITDQLNALQMSQQELIGKQISETSRARVFTQAEQTIQRGREDRTLNLAGTEGIVDAINTVESITNDFLKTTALGAATGIKGIDKVLKDPAGFFKALGETINPFSKGEGVGAFFTPLKQPEVDMRPSNPPPVPSRTGNNPTAGSTYNVTFNVTGNNPEQIADTINKKFSSFIDTYANTILARELNLNGGLG